MKIYPDPELPDIQVEWGDQDCRAITGNVAVTITGVDSASTETMTVPCSDLRVTFADVARERFHIAGALLDLAGNVFSTNDSDVDLRNGFNESVGLYFDGFSNFRVAWTFEGGTTCQSLGVTYVAISFSLPDEPDVVAFEYPCELTRVAAQAPEGTFTARMRAFAGEAVVAASEETAPFEVTPEGLTDFGTLTLVPCGAACP
ncbi:hypothetical protein BH11MYX3_BH11MYX3_30250 [soil metagenome]